MKNIIANIFAFLSLFAALGIMVFIILDKGAEITKDGYPTTSNETYIVLVIAVILFALLAWIVKTRETDKTFECPYCHRAVTYKPFKKNGVVRGESVICSHCQGKIYISTSLFKKQTYAIP